MVFKTGTAADGERAIAPLPEAVPAPMFNWVGEMPSPAMQFLFDPFFPKGLRWPWKGDFVKALPDEAIIKHSSLAAFAGCPMCVSGGRFFRDAVDRPIDWTQMHWSARDLVDDHRRDRLQSEMGRTR